MDLSLGMSWQGWRADAAVTFSLDSAFCEAPAGAVVQLVKRLPVCAGELVVFEVLARRTSSVEAGTEAQWQGLQLNYYPFEGSQAGGPAQPNIGAGRSRANEIVLRSELQEYRVALAIPVTAGPGAFVEICCGSFAGSAAGFEFLHPRVSIERAVFGAARQVAAGRLVWDGGLGQFAIDPDSPGCGLEITGYAGGVLQVSAPPLACTPRVLLHAEASVTTRGLLARAGSYQKNSGELVIELVSLTTGELLGIETIPGAELALNLTLEV